MRRFLFKCKNKTFGVNHRNIMSEKKNWFEELQMLVSVMTLLVLCVSLYCSYQVLREVRRERLLNNTPYLAIRDVEYYAASMVSNPLKNPFIDVFWSPKLNESSLFMNENGRFYMLKEDDCLDKLVFKNISKQQMLNIRVKLKSNIEKEIDWWARKDNQRIYFSIDCLAVNGRSFSFNPNSVLDNKNNIVWEYTCSSLSPDETLNVPLSNLYMAFCEFRMAEIKKMIASGVTDLSAAKEFSSIDIVIEFEDSSNNKFTQPFVVQHTTTQLGMFYEFKFSREFYEFGGTDKHHVYYDPFLKGKFYSTSPIKIINMRN